MKIRFYLDSGVNIHSCRSAIFDLERDFDITNEAWESMSEDERHTMVEEWASNYLEMGYEVL